MTSLQTTIVAERLLKDGISKFLSPTKINVLMRWGMVIQQQILKRVRGGGGS
jgi:hypothetical protein